MVGAREGRPGAIRRSLAVALALVLLALQPTGAGASETDQYTLPAGREFANLDVYFSRRVQAAIVEAVNEANASIRAPPADRPLEETTRLQSPDGIAAKVWERLYIEFSINEAIDGALAEDAVRSAYPGLVVAHRPGQHIYDHPLLTVDITKFVRTLFRSSTVNVNGTLFGTDKLVHFVHLGHMYYEAYRGALQSGAGEAEAVARAAGLSSGANIFLSESALLGLWVTGIRSNADLAANYAGFKFYRNLTEEVRIGRQVLPPMLVRDGSTWRVDGRVRARSGFFAAFVTPHWNEALNPNTYAPLVDAVVRSMLKSRCPEVLDWYRDERGRRRNRQQFAAIEKELATFYGEPYGHRDDGENTVSIANTCFDADGPASAAREPGRAVPATTSAVPAWPGGDELGRTELWWAARNGDLRAVERLLAQVENPNAVDLDGEGPLHAAARRGHVAVVEILLANGADPRAPALYGMTPLHAAVDQSQAGAARALLAAGAEANARDAFGRTPLHLAVLQGDRAAAALLLDYGADPTAVYAGRTPDQLAARAGEEALARWLVAYRPNPMARTGVGAPPGSETRSKSYTPLPRMPAKPGPRGPGQPVS